MADDVIVSRGWGDSRVAEVPQSALSGLHMTTASGGVKAPLPYPTLSAYVSCACVADVEFGHSGRHGACPHSIKVLIFKSQNRPGVYRELRAAAS